MATAERKVFCVLQLAKIDFVVAEKSTVVQKVPEEDVNRVLSQYQEICSEAILGFQLPKTTV